MRLFLPVLVLFAIPLIVFLVYNDREEVTIYLSANTVYEQVPVWIVVLLAVAAGAGMAGLIAIAEGAAIRLANRKLRKELRALETEVNLLRTESTGRRPPELEQPGPRALAPAAASEAAADELLPSAPVYGGDEFDPYRDE